MKFRQLESAPPQDIEAIMLPEEVERLINDLKECEGEESVVYDNAVQALDTNNRINGIGDIVFVIPGDEAGETGDLIPELEDYLEDLNNKILEDMEKDD